VFQNSRTPPSNAVYGPSEKGFWATKEGSTEFPFEFKIPEDAPSSYKFLKKASLKYEVTG
jgi:hypothetical protein